MYYIMFLTLTGGIFNNTVWTFNRYNHLSDKHDSITFLRFWRFTNYFKRFKYIIGHIINF
jgi:hypothetical protein